MGGWQKHFCVLVSTPEWTTGIDVWPATSCSNREYREPEQGLHGPRCKKDVLKELEVEG
jgi:hypothetical protein